MSAMLADHLQDAFSRHRPLGVDLADWSSEVRSGVRFLLLAALLRGSQATTFGTQLYGMQLYGLSSGKYSRARLLLALCGLSYLRDRLHYKPGGGLSASSANSPSLARRLALGALSLLELANLAVFLRSGGPASLAHRLAGARRGHPGPPTVPATSAFAFVDRELIWCSFAELLATAGAALADARRLLSTKPKKSKGSRGGFDLTFSSPPVCGLCDQEVTCHPALCGGCGRVAWCYICLASRLPHACAECGTRVAATADLAAMMTSAAAAAAEAGVSSIDRMA